jgi:ABC-2 type transport system permease protein
MNFIKQEIKFNLKTVLIWVFALAILITLIISLHPIAIQKMPMMDEMIKQMPKELLQAFNLNNYDFNNIINYFSYEFQYILLASCIFGALLGSNIIAKEENSKTISFLYSKPISRTAIMIIKLLVILLYIIIFNLALCLISIAAMNIVSTKSIDNILIIKIFLGQAMAQLTFAYIGSLLATILKRPIHIGAISSGIVIITYMLGMISKITDKVNYLAYISPIHYVIPDAIVTKGYIEFKYIIIMILIMIVSLFSSILIYRKKDFNV